MDSFVAIWWLYGIMNQNPNKSRKMKVAKWRINVF